jgi:aryl-alcohol dehydrogenase-like predicted oxidoreductase
VQTVEQALRCLDYPGVAAIQIVFNIFRQRPIEEFFARAAAAGVGILARIPLASGLLTGQFTVDTVFAADDHRNFNRNGEAFDVGETFAGVDYEQGLAAVEELRPLVPAEATMAQFALRWILMFNEVSATIPGASRPAHVQSNMDSAGLAPIEPAVMAQITRIYQAHIAPSVANRW